VCVPCAVINGEKAAYSTPVFADKRERTLDLLLKNIEQKNYTTKVRPNINMMRGLFKLLLEHRGKICHHNPVAKKSAKKLNLEITDRYVVQIYLPIPYHIYNGTHRKVCHNVFIVSP